MAVNMSLFPKAWLDVGDGKIFSYTYLVSFFASYGTADLAKSRLVNLSANFDCVCDWLLYLQNTPKMV